MLQNPPVATIMGQYIYEPPKSLRLDSLRRSPHDVASHPGLPSVHAADNDSPRERLLLDFGWKFHLGNEWGLAQNLSRPRTGSGLASMSFSDASWRGSICRTIGAIELPSMSARTAVTGSGFGRRIPEQQCGVVSPQVDLPKADAGKRLWLEFNGAFRDCAVFVNGCMRGPARSGYSNFRFDITDGGGVQPEKCRRSESGRDAKRRAGSGEGAGPVSSHWLVKTGPIAIAPGWGVLFTASSANNVPRLPTELHLQTPGEEFLPPTRNWSPLITDIYGPKTAQPHQATRSQATKENRLFPLLQEGSFPTSSLGIKNCGA